MKKKLVSIVLNNFKNDSRVLKEINVLGSIGYDATICALQTGDEPLTEQHEHFRVLREPVKRKKLPKGQFFGLLIYFRLIFVIVKKYRKYDVWHCNDLEPLIMAWIAKKLNPKLKVVYDAHEYQRERNGRSGVLKKMTAIIEPIVIKSADEVITVSQGIVDEYKRLYKLEQVHLIYNAPHKKQFSEKYDLFREKFNIPSDHTILLYQGIFTIGRGIDLLIESFRELKGEKLALVFLGGGMFEEKVAKAAEEHENIHFHPSVPYTEIIKYSSSADFGLNSVENVCLSYFYCMPNKLFEYMQAGIPIITTPLHDCRNLVESRKLGLVIPSFEIDDFKKTFRLAGETDPNSFTEALQQAAKDFNWELEAVKFQEIYQKWL